MILDGKLVAQNIYTKLKNTISSLDTKPKLDVILVWNNPSSLRYIAQKQKWAQEVGIVFHLHHFPENISETEISKTIEKCNQDESCSGIIVQLPLPKHFHEKNILNAIHPEKDVDGFHPINQGKIVIDDKTGLTACTPAGVLELCRFYKIDLIGKNIVLIGRSNIVGKPLANLLINAWATITVCNSKTKNIDFFTQNADIVITAMGSPKFLTLDKIQNHTIVIDVGFSVIDGKIYGDCDFENILKNGNSITPVPGWVGSLTVAMLLNNTFLAYSRKKK